MNEALSPDVQRRAHEGGLAVFSAGCSVRRLGLRLVPVLIPLYVGDAVIHLIHRQQRHLGEQEHVSVLVE